MERQIYQNVKSKIEIYISEKAERVMSSIHPMSRCQIIVIPERRIVIGNKWETELREELIPMINRKNSEEIIMDTINSLKAYMYSYQP